MAEVLETLLPSGPQLIGDWWELAAWTGRLPNEPKLAKSTMAFKQDLEPHNTIFQMSKIQMILTYLGRVRTRIHTHTNKRKISIFIIKDKDQTPIPI